MDFREVKKITSSSKGKKGVLGVRLQVSCLREGGHKPLDVASSEVV